MRGGEKEREKDTKLVTKCKMILAVCIILY